MDQLLSSFTSLFSNHPLWGVAAAAFSYFLLRKFFFTLVILVFVVFIGAQYLGK